MLPRPNKHWREWRCAVGGCVTSRRLRQPGIMITMATGERGTRGAEEEEEGALQVCGSAGDWGSANGGQAEE